MLGKCFAPPPRAEQGNIGSPWPLFHLFPDAMVMPCREKIVEGRVGKIAGERALMEQPYIKDPKKTLAQHIKETIAALGENIAVRRFARFNLGEGLAKKEDNFAEEVAKATGGS